MTFPNTVNCTAGTTVTSPVTQTALVAVKSASIKRIGCVLEIGNVNKIPPRKMVAINPIANNCIVLNLIFLSDEYSIAFPS